MILVLILSLTGFLLLLFIPYSRGIESEYLPHEIASRGIFFYTMSLYVVLLSEKRTSRNYLSFRHWTDKEMPRHIPGGILTASVIMIFTENNWDADLRDNLTGLAVFGLVFFMLLLPFLWRSIRKYPLSAILLIIGLIVLGLGELKDIHGLSGLSGSEEYIELVSSVLIMYSFVLFSTYEGGPRTKRFLTIEKWTVIGIIGVITIGNAMLMMNRGDIPPVWQIVAGICFFAYGLLKLRRLLLDITDDR